VQRGGGVRVPQGRRERSRVQWPVMETLCLTPFLTVDCGLCVILLLAPCTPHRRCHVGRAQLPPLRLRAVSSPRDAYMRGIGCTRSPAGVRRAVRGLTTRRWTI
jgi:hypothetical protein